MEVGLSSGPGWGQKGYLRRSGHIRGGRAGSQAGGGDVSLFSQETMQRSGHAWGDHAKHRMAGRPRATVSVGMGRVKATGDGSSPGRGLGAQVKHPPTHR